MKLILIELIFVSKCIKEWEKNLERKSPLVLKIALLCCLEGFLSVCLSVEKKLKK